MAHMEKRDMHTGFRWENMKERENLEDLSVYGRIALEWELKKLDESELDSSGL